MKLLSLLVLSFSLFQAGAYAETRDELARNYETCESSDESWHRRWGQYVVAFEYNQATELCREQYWPNWAEAHMTGCYHNGAWINAGYYCHEIAPGSR